MPENVTLKAIGQRVGYSKNTVSLALRGDRQIPLRTRRRICKIARVMGYRPNALVSHFMARLRSSNANVSFRATLALVNAHPDRDAATVHAAIAARVAGCQARASQLGYRFDEFWANDPEATANRWLRILSTRAIQGLIIVGLPEDGCLPRSFEPVWRRFPTVVAGVRPHGADLPFTSVDHYEVPRLAIRRAIALGYHRPALVIDERIDRALGGRLGAGMLAAQQDLPAGDRIEPFRATGDGTPGDFARWFSVRRPDVLLSAHSQLASWLDGIGLRSPADVGLIQLDRSESEPGFAGIDHHHHQAGTAAVDLMASAIHRGADPASVVPTGTLIAASWMDGPSVKALCRTRLDVMPGLGRAPGVAA